MLFTAHPLWIGVDQMPKGGAPKGRPRPKGSGRVKGTPNKSTRDVREAIARVLQDNAENFAKWLAQVAEGIKEARKDSKGKEYTVWLAEPNPGKAMDIAMNMAEYHIPKLARTEMTGAGGGAIIMKTDKTDEAL